MARMSNRDRIARAAEEARAAAAEKAAKAAPKAASASAPKRKRAAPAPKREKIVWEIYGSNGATVKTFGYADKAAAEAHIVALTHATTNRYGLRGTRVPMV
ncbi:MAG: hypothetical protein JNK02_09960 [Planctomycetes bacterium]|nr:hypothetical protein [Planctomycetota bacterium]